MRRHDEGSHLDVRVRARLARGVGAVAPRPHGVVPRRSRRHGARDLLRPQARAPLRRLTLKRFFVVLLLVPALAGAEVKPLATGGFDFERTIVVRGTPTQVYDM